MTNDAVTNPFTVIVDGSEKLPYTFTGLLADADKQHRPLVVPVKRRYLRTADYTIEGLEDRVCIERKSLNDLFATLGQHRERFRREHQRMAEFEWAAVVIEADIDAILFDPPRSGLDPKNVFRTWMSWPQRYGVPWYLVGTHGRPLGNRRLGEITTFRLLEKFWQHDQERQKRKRRSKT